MSTTPSLNPLTDPSKAAKLTNEQWVALHVPRFREIRGWYETYGAFLTDVFSEACSQLGMIAIVTARAKGVASFAEKILRKRKHYTDPNDPLPPDPVVRLTDLCGGRVILETSEQVETVCRFIKRAFDIDEANSEDVSQRLKPTEFGYRSVHYIVTVNPAKLKAAHIHVHIPGCVRGFGPKVIGPSAANRPLKAEIQVRTLLEHAWSDLGHDMTYKTELKVPDRIHRRFATVAAVLEGADRELGRLVGTFNTYRANLGAHHSRAEMNEEINLRRIVLDSEPTNLTLALKTAQLCHAIGRHEEALKLLDTAGRRRHPAVYRFLGQWLTELHWGQPDGVEFRRGCRLLEAACEREDRDAETLCALAECRARGGQTAQARELFEKAVQMDATQPLVLCRYLEFEIEKAGNTHVVRLAAPMIRKAMERAHAQIEARVNLPGAWFSLAVFHLLLQEPFAALSALGQVVCLCEAGCLPKVGAKKAAPFHPCAAGRLLLRGRDTLERLRPASRELDGFDWLERFLILILAVRVGDKDAEKTLARLASKESPVRGSERRVVILSGGCAPGVQPFVDKLRKPLLEACQGLSFTLISGGTQAGISGLAGKLAAASQGRIRAVGYLSGKIPYYTKKDAQRFSSLIPSAGSDFTPLEHLQMWTDLVRAKIAPAEVKLLCYAPGKIAGAECAMALALGARVGLVEDSALPEERRFNAPEWTRHPGFGPLPLDTMTLRAFLQIPTTPLTAKEQKRFEKAARMAHEEYVKSSTPKDPSLQKWDELDPALKLSNYHQVVFWQNALAEYGLGLRKVTAADKKRSPLKMEELVGRKGIQWLAQLEHGRWNIERLYYGWRFAKEKDIARRLNPCLAPWPALKNVNGMDYQPYDIDAISSLPRKLREAGLEIYRKPRS